MKRLTKLKKILIIDFGSQFTQLIARRIREIGVFSEIVSHKGLSKLDQKELFGIILSGGPLNVYQDKKIKFNKNIFNLTCPILGICFGHQMISKFYGGKVKSSKTREFGFANIKKIKNSLLTKNFFNKKNTNDVWMSHADHVTKIPRNFKKIASTKDSKFTIIENFKLKRFGVQFHPEVTHTINGSQIFKNFLFLICKIKKKWNIASQKNRLIQDIKNKVQNDKVICALSGGVDSSVVALLINKAIKKNLICIMVDTGLMRKNEFKYTYKIFKKKYKLNVILIDASNMFLSRLKNVFNPEKKRKIIGNLFVRIFEKESKKFKKIKYLAQGTLYPDVIESLSKVGKTSVTIKSHHNVGGLPKKMKLKLLEPLSELFKDEVRLLGKELNVPEAFLNRHPFPGPGLAIRLLGCVNEKNIKILRKADSIFINLIKEEGLYDKIWQAFCVLLPVNTVGVMGDNRTYEKICVLRAVTSIDGMTAETYKFNDEFIKRCANEIINRVPGINRVCYDITSKPPGTIEFE